MNGEPEREVRMNIRIKPDDKALIEQAARKEDLPFSAWVRQVLLKAARQVLGRV